MTSTIDTNMTAQVLAEQRLGLPLTNSHTASVLADSRLIREALSNMIVAVAAWKGGVGKTELAKELAWLLSGVLVDFDWDGGGASRAWGYRHEDRTNAPLLDAVERGRTPRPLKGGEFRADLVPSHPDWGANQPDTEELSNQITRWAGEWQRPIVIDTHPGGSDSTYAAVGSAHVVLTPVLLENRPLNALESMAEELRTYPLLIIPNAVSSAPKKMVDRLSKIGETYGIPIGPIVTRHSWLAQRQHRMAVVARQPAPARSRQFVNEMIDVTRAVIELAIDGVGERE